MIRIMITSKCDQFNRLWGRKQLRAMQFKERVESNERAQYAKSAKWLHQLKRIRASCKIKCC